MLGHAAAKADEALALTAVLEARQCDAIVLLGDFRGERRLVADLRSTHVRVVALWQGAARRGRPFPTVGVDNRAGIHAALEHLTSLGHRRIAFVGAGTWGDAQERLAAYRGYSERVGVTPAQGLHATRAEHAPWWRARALGAAGAVAPADRDPRSDRHRGDRPDP